MDRIKIVVELQKLEVRKNTFERMLHDIDSYYSDDVILNPTIGGQIYNRKYMQEDIEVNKHLFGKYIVLEIETLESKIIDLIGKLNG